MVVRRRAELDSLVASGGFWAPTEQYYNVLDLGVDARLDPERDQRLRDVRRDVEAAAFVRIEFLAVTSTVCPTGESTLPNDEAALICTALLPAPNVSQKRPARSGGRPGYPMPR